MSLDCTACMVRRRFAETAATLVGGCGCETAWPWGVGWGIDRGVGRVNYGMGHWKVASPSWTARMRIALFRTQPAVTCFALSRPLPLHGHRPVPQPL